MDTLLSTYSTRALNTSKSSHGLQLVVEEGAKEFSGDVSNLPSIDSTEAVLGGGSSCLAIVQIRLPVVPVGFFASSALFAFFAALSINLVVSVLCALSGLLDFSDSLEGFWGLDGDDHELTSGVVRDGSPIAASHALELTEDSGKVAHLPLDSEVHKNVTRVHNEGVEKFDSTSLGGESLNIVRLGLEILDEGVRSGEAVGKLNICAFKITSIKTSVLHTLHESEPVGASARGIDNEAADLSGSTCSSSVASRDHVHSFDIKLALGVVETDKTLAVVSLELAFVLISALLSVS